MADMTYKVHELKILPRYYTDIKEKGKCFEIRKSDRDYHIGDRLLLKEWDGERYTGRTLKRTIVYIHFGTGEFGLAEGYCVLGLSDDGEPYRPT